MANQVKKYLIENKRDMIEGAVFMVTMVAVLYIALDFGAKMGF